MKLGRMLKLRRERLRFERCQTFNFWLQKIYNRCSLLEWKCNVVCFEKQQKLFSIKFCTAEPVSFNFGQITFLPNIWQEQHQLRLDGLHFPFSWKLHNFYAWWKETGIHKLRNEFDFQVFCQNFVSLSTIPFHNCSEWGWLLIKESDFNRNRHFLHILKILAPSSLPIILLSKVFQQEY